MRGAPDLAAEDIGNVQKFNEFLKQHAQYAANARDQNATWSTVAGLLSRYAEDLAIAFTACASKRGEHTSYTTEQVLNLSDDAFEKLYVESCFPSVEYPSEVLEVLQNISFRRQHSKEASPLHAVMRAAEAFRVQLRLLPSHAVHQCTEDGILIAFFRLLFGDDAKRRRMDFQHCTTWAEARTALIQRATSQPSWFGDSLKETSMESDLGTTKKSVSTSVQSAASSQSSQDTTKPAAYYERRASQLIKEGALEGIDTSGLSAKQVVKLATKLRFAAKKHDIVAGSAAASDPNRSLLDALAKQQDHFATAFASQQVETTKALQAIQLTLARLQQPPRDSSRERDRGNSNFRETSRERERGVGTLRESSRDRDRGAHSRIRSEEPLHPEGQLRRQEGIPRYEHATAERSNAARTDNLGHDTSSYRRTSSPAPRQAPQEHSRDSAISPAQRSR
jgi:hypothetical protein